VNLWDLIPASKATDPAVCHQAEEAMNADGRRTRTVVLIEMALSTGPKTNHELAEITPRYGARIYDLRRLGYAITTQIKGGTTTYTMNKGA
jgi:hypothetical protein